MNIDSLLQPYQHFGVNLGLSRIVKILTKLGSPHQQFPIIHIAGSNGKGSVCAYLSSILTEAGYKTALYTSPHLVNWTERICINNKQITEEEFCKLIIQIQAAIDSSEEFPTQFEIITAAAWLYFAQQKVDIAIIEVGLGGRLDATNVCEHPLVTVITSISLEHCQQLGPTITHIAREKAGIIKKSCPVVMGQLPVEAQEVVRSRSLELQCPLIAPSPAQQTSPGYAKFNNIEYPLPLKGEIQLHNSALALSVLEILQQKGWHITQDSIVTGMRKTQWPGRMQWINWNNHQLLIDGAHNPASAVVLRNYVDTLKRKNITWVMGMLDTKDHSEILQALLKPGDKLYIVPVPESNSANLIELAQLAISICPELQNCTTYVDVFLALEAAYSDTDNPDNLVVLSGSLYLIGYFFRNQPSVGV